MSENDDILSKFDTVTKIPGHDIYYNYCQSDRIEDNGATSNVYHQSGYDFIEFRFDDNTFDGTVEDIFEYLNDGKSFLDLHLYAMDYTFYSDSCVKMKITDERDAEINGLDAKRITAVAGDHDEHYIYGYTFIMDGIPCYLMGIVLDGKTHYDLITEVTAEVDIIASTIRDQYEIK